MPILSGTKASSTLTQTAVVSVSLSAGDYGGFGVLPALAEIHGRSEASGKRTGKLRSPSLGSPSPVPVRLTQQGDACVS